MPVSSSSSTGIVNPRARAADATPGCHLERVDRRGDGRALGQVAQPLQLLLPDDRVADEDVFDPAARHHLRLAELRHLNADRARLDLQSGDLGQLVRLRVRTQRDAGLAGHRRDPCDVRPHRSRSITTSGVSSTRSARAATRSSSAGSAAMVFTAGSSS